MLALTWREVHGLYVHGLYVPEHEDGLDCFDTPLLTVSISCDHLAGITVNDRNVATKRDWQERFWVSRMLANTYE